MRFVRSNELTEYCWFVDQYNKILYGRIEDIDRKRYLHILFYHNGNLQKRIIDFSYYYAKGKIGFLKIICDCEQMVAFLKERTVKYLVHFTHIANLPGILNGGIVPRKNLPTEVKTTDEFRYDGYTDCSCLSISYPNYPMLYKNKDKYIILLMAPELLLDFPQNNIAFYPTNAASAIVRKQGFDAFIGINSLKAMFSPSVITKRGEVRRDEQNLMDEHTTDPQAEILVKGIIKPEHIVRIYTYNDSLLTETCKILLSHRKFSQIQVSCREDYYWTTGTRWKGYEQLRRANNGN